MYYFTKQYEEKDKEGISKIIFDYYKEMELKKGNSKFDRIFNPQLPDKLIQKEVNRILDDLNNTKYVTYFVKNDETVCGIIRFYNLKYSKTINATITIFKLVIPEEQEKNNILSLIIDDYINIQRPFTINYLADYNSEQFNDLLENGFTGFHDTKKTYYMTKEIEYVRKPNNTSE